MDEQNLFGIKARKIKHEISRDFNSTLEEKRKSISCLPLDIKDITSNFVSLFSLNLDFFEFDGELNFHCINKIVKLFLIFNFRIKP